MLSICSPEIKICDTESMWWSCPKGDCAEKIWKEYMALIMYERPLRTYLIPKDGVIVNIVFTWLDLVFLYHIGVVLLLHKQFWSSFLQIFTFFKFLTWSVAKRITFSFPIEKTDIFALELFYLLCNVLKNNFNSKGNLKTPQLLIANTLIV